MPNNNIKIGTLQRTFETGKVDNENKTVELSFSSEEPYQRFFGYEILSHKKEAVDFNRLKNSAPLLLDHDHTKQIGVVEDVYLDGSKARAVVRFSKNSSLATEIFADISDGIRKNVSVGYSVKEMELTGTKDEIDEYTVTKWEPFEISVVSVPADQSVGFGRSDEAPKGEVKILNNSKKEASMPKEKQDVDVAAAQAEARTAERTRAREIGAIGAKHNMVDMATKAIEDGTSVDEVRTMVLEKLVTAKPVDTKATEIGMKEAEIQGYSFARALKAAVSGKWEGATIEKAASDKVAKMLGKDARGFYVPHEILKREITTAGGASTIDTTTGGASFIDILRNKLMLLKLGGQVLSGLSGNVAIPKQTGSATAYWIAEGAATTASDLALGMLELSPKTVSAKSGYTRNMLLQGNPSIEALVMNDLAAAIALEIDRAGFNGTGADGQPKGILNTTGVGAVDCATVSGGLTNDSVIDLETSIASGNADVDNMNYVAGAVVTGKLKKKAIEDGHPTKILANGEVNGYKHNRTNQVPANTMVFGDFSQVITALWGGLDIMIDQYSNADTGGVVVRAFQSVDVGVRYPEAFSATTNIDQ